MSSLTARNLADRWVNVLEELPEHLAFVRSTVRQGMLVIDLTDVGLVLRPDAEVIFHRLADKMTDLKEHLQQVYGAPVGVQLMPAGVQTENGGRRSETVSQSAVSGEPRATSNQLPDDLLPIEEALVRLFKAKKVTVFNGNGS